jgi:SulP family sulfate permease
VSTTALREPRTSLLGDVSGSLADLGVMVPIVAALVIKNHFDAATILVGVGALYILAGAYFRVPVPVQPIKAAAALAIAKDLPPSTLAAAGVVLGAILTVASVTKATALIERVFTKPIVRGVQLGVGLILFKTALHLEPKPTPTTYVVAAAVAAVMLWARRWRRLPVALGLVAGGVLYSLFVRHQHFAVHAALWHPHIAHVFDAHVLWSGFVLLVIPQLPLTFGNAIVALSDVEHRYFGPGAARVSPTSVSLSCGLANMAAGALGGMPMCHGSGGLTAHYQAGARTNRMNFAIGGALLVLGVFLGPVAVSILGLIPIAVLMGLLAFTGALHAWLVSDLRGIDLGVALAMGVVGLATGNLAVALALGLAVSAMRWTLRRSKERLRRP